MGFEDDLMQMNAYNGKYKAYVVIFSTASFGDDFIRFLFMFPMYEMQLQVLDGIIIILGLA